MAQFDHVVTQRLDLRAVSPDDLEPLFEINSDPGTWRHFPQGRHVRADVTRDWIRRAVAHWRDDGLSYWTVRRRSDGVVIGIGGVQRHPEIGWNLYYRFSPSTWGNGYATEMSRAAVEMAHLADPEAPVVAWIASHNRSSRRVAERLGFTNYGPRRNAGNGATQLAYADRPLLPEQPGRPEVNAPSDR